MAHALRKTLRRRRSIAVHVLAWFVIFLEVICLLLIVGTDSLTFGFRELLSLLKVCETADFFVCFLGKKHGQIFAKSGFTQGTPEEFRTFIAEKTGKPVQYIK